MKHPMKVLLSVFIVKTLLSHAFLPSYHSRAQDVFAASRKVTISPLHTKPRHHSVPPADSAPRREVNHFPGDTEFSNNNAHVSRRSILSTSAVIIFSLAAENVLPKVANAMVGTLPEYSDSNAVLQGITVQVSDSSQQQQMISFLEDGFGMEKSRQRIQGSVTDTWMAFGPEQMSIPEDWEPGVSSFSSYGGHASIHIRYDSQTTEAFYRSGGESPTPPGDNIAYLQMGVPNYRISQMVKNGGNVYNGYGIVEVISPSGLPIRGIIGISPDPIMFVAINCQDVKKSKEFYEQLGFVEQDYPYCRPNKGAGQFEPPQPKNSIYMAPSKNSMGILLLKSKKKGNPKPNSAIRSLNIVYQPVGDTVVDPSSDLLLVKDPSSVPIAFNPIDVFESVERSTRKNRA